MPRVTVPVQLSVAAPALPAMPTTNKPSKAIPSRPDPSADSSGQLHTNQC